MGNKTYSAEIKAKAVLELMKEEKTASELATEYGTSANKYTTGGKTLRRIHTKFFRKIKSKKKRRQK